MTKDAAVEHGPNGIRVNAIAPAAVMTEILKDAINSEQVNEESMGAMQPLKRMGTVDEMTNAIYFLASDKASFIIGVTLPVDGSFTAK